MLAAAFAFSAPATAQDAPGDAPTDVSTSTTDSGGAGDGPDAGSSEGETEPAPTEPAETPESGTEPSENPPSESETTPSEPTEPAEETTPTEEANPADPAAPAEECSAEAAGCEPADTPGCDAGAKTASPAATTDSPADCADVVELEPEPTTPPPPPAPPAPTPPPSAPQPAASPAGSSSIVLLIAEPGTVAAPSQPVLANGLVPEVGRTATLTSAVVLGGSDETGATTAADEPSGAIDVALALAQRSEGTSSERVGACTPLSLAGTVTLSNSCAHSQRESILTVGTETSLGAGEATIPPPPPPDTPLERHRRTHPEAQSDPERPAVAVAPATSTRDHGRRLSGGGAPGGSSAAAGLRIFAVSTSPLLLTAPVTFPTEPQPSVLPEGEPGVPPPASPG